MQYTVTPAQIGKTTVTVPGDKSISHRALMLGGIAAGESRISGFLAGEDCLATLAAMRSMGVQVTQPATTELVIQGVGLDGLQDPSESLDLGNSGTAMRLMAGLLAGQSFNTTLTGDASLSTRPMQRIIAPLTEMGAAIESDCDGTPPLQISGGLKLRPIHYDLPMASAQVKSAVLLAGLYAKGETSVTEPASTRDHTERMLQTMGCEVVTRGNRISVQGRPSLHGCELQVPADLSSAAFIMLAAVISADADILIENVGVNPTRTGVIDILQSMGADIALENPRLLGAEPVADIRARASRLTGTTVDPELVPLAIDEFPALFVAAAAAAGATTFAGLAELRVKESDRIGAMADGLTRLGIRVDESSDGAVVHGGRFTGGQVRSFDDHRIAMALAIAATIATDKVVIDDVDNVETSFPGFRQVLSQIGGKIQ